jgi:hypothetical protein
MSSGTQFTSRGVGLHVTYCKLKGIIYRKLALTSIKLLSWYFPGRTDVNKEELVRIAEMLSAVAEYFFKQW